MWLKVVAEELGEDGNFFEVHIAKKKLRAHKTLLREYGDFKSQYYEIRPCPFCGGEAGTKESRFEGAGYYAECKRCRAITRLFKTEAEAIKAWNTRKWKTCRLELEEPNEDGVWWCSYCKSYHQHKSKYPWAYCPRCGAKVVER